MPLPDGRVPDEAEILPDTGLEFRLTGSKASTDTKLHHTSRGVRLYTRCVPVSCTIHKRHPQFPLPYIFKWHLRTHDCAQEAPQFSQWAFSVPRSLHHRVAPQAPPVSNATRNRHSVSRPRSTHQGVPQ